MARTRKNSPWLKEKSDRSGFDSFDRFGKRRWRSVKQNGLTLEPEEFDTPPPSTKSLGGSSISQGGNRVNWDTTAIPAVSTQQIQYISAAGGILFTTQPWIMVAGSNTAINITANPQVQLGQQGDYIAVQCVGSNVTLENGSGLSLTAGRSFVMTSGSIINLFCNRTDNLWVETARVQNGGI